MKRRAFVAQAARTLGAVALGQGFAPDAVFGAVASAGEVDIVIRGGTIFDGLGGGPFEGDVAIAADRIVAIARRIAERGAEEIDARGLAVAPGFIDIHSHTDSTVLVDLHAPGKLLQGVTTEIVGVDGGSMGPWTDEQFERQRERWRERSGIDIDFRDPVGFMRFVRRLGSATNLFSMVGSGTVRAFVMGEDDRPPTDEELARMVAEVARALRGGAVGLSSGLEYTPGGFASLDELVALARPLAGTGLPYMTHMRNEDDRLLAAIEEAINVGRFAGVPVEISHLKAQGERNWWKAGPALATIERARDDGVDVAFDVYPYVAYRTGLANLFPLWARDGGTAAFQARLQDPAQRERLEALVGAKIESLGSWDAVQVTSTALASHAYARGRRLGSLAGERGVQPYDLLVEILLSGGGGMVGFGMSEENVARMLAHPLSVVCSDGSALATTGPLAAGVPHPRNSGTFPRVLGRYVREQRVLPLETAIAKMTSMPAARVGLLDRGRLAEGMYADVVVFDPDTIGDRATFEQPHQYAVGVRDLITNGRAAVRHGSVEAGSL
ncbi:MAG TPA: D-aminoacylase [Longimicrobiales bacterium]|nr:D-aminoacylase [Longimicrobiales bacterium]